MTSGDKLKAKGKRLAAPAKIEPSATCLDGETQEYDPATFSSLCYCLEVVEAWQVGDSRKTCDFFFSPLCLYVKS